MTVHRRTTLALLAAAATGLFSRMSNAQSSELARVVLGFPAGSSIDALARRVADKLAPAYAKTVVVENRVGGGGQVAVSSLKGTPADGNAILLSPMSILGVYPHTYKRSWLARSPQWLVL
jgi:tripartite-type tricarboxylate transporter receptor subunit TctC